MTSPINEHTVRAFAFLLPFALLSCSCNRGQVEARPPAEIPASTGGASASLDIPVERRPDSADRRALGELPAELGALRWPEPPRIEREANARTESEAQRAVDQPGTRVRITGPIREPITIHGSDIEIVFEPEGQLDRVVIDRGVQRVRIAGGGVNAIELLPPATWDPDARYDESLFVTDITLEGLRMAATDSAFVIRGRRVAILDCDVTAERYSLWAGDTGPLNGEDLIVAHNRFRSAGPESTLRMHDIDRSVVVSNILSNGAKHDYRVHGRSDLAYAARNILLRTGIMIGTQPEDRVGTVIFENNILHHEAPSLLEINPGQIARLILRNNVVYTNVWESFYPYPSVERGWIVEGNRRLPFQAWTPPE